MSPKPEPHLFANRDFVRPDDVDTYNQLATELMSELAPGTILEQIHAAEALTAAWRLHRLAAMEDLMIKRGVENQPDPMADPEHANLQQSIDRARTQYTNLLRRATAEVRRLQRERAAISEQTQSEPATPPSKPELPEFSREPEPETDRLMAEAIRQSWEDMQNDAEYQAVLVEAYQRGLARRARESAISEQTQSPPPADIQQAA